MTEVPQVYLRARVSVGRESAFGIAAEGLPPKWFTKDPATTFEQDLADMFAVIGHATAIAGQIAAEPIGFFDFWRELDRSQSEWARTRGIAPLLAHFGVSLVERCVLDGLCRVVAEPLHRVVATNRLGLRLGDVYPELSGVQPADFLPPAPLESCHVRHTIGLADALTPDDIAPADRVDDGLPQDVLSSVRAYGLRYFKVKLSGDPERDVPRLLSLVRLLQQETDGRWFATLDGNENFHDFDTFRTFWERAQAAPGLDDLWRRLVVVEQPVHRDHALSPEARAALHAWPDRPPMIVDESDGAIGDVPMALEFGYVGASHKNCKGIVKGIANAAVLARRHHEGRPAVLTGEDLCILGPVALQQDLAMMALLGIGHVERNGHHYYRGLSMLPAVWQEETLARHGDLYTRHELGFARLHIVEGRVQLGSVNRAPFGIQPALDPTIFTSPKRVQREGGPL